MGYIAHVISEREFEVRTTLGLPSDYVQDEELAGTYVDASVKQEQISVAN